MTENTKEIKISAVIITQNNEDTIKKCLESVQDINNIDDIIVVDSFSSDKTIEIVKQYTKRIYSRKWDNFVNQRDYALSLVRREWVLFLDSDEALDEDLAKEVSAVLERNGKYTGYKVKRITFFLDRELKYAQKPNYALRLFKKSKSYLPRNMLDEQYETENEGCIDKGVLYHFTSTSIRQRMAKINLYSTLFACDFYKTDQAKWWFMKAIYWPVRSFFGNYFVNRGFKDGWQGLLWCILKATQHFLAYSKIGLKRLRTGK